jgi:hypothetical protein
MARSRIAWVTHSVCLLHIWISLDRKKTLESKMRLATCDRFDFITSGDRHSYENGMQSSVGFEIFSFDT